MGDEKVIGYFVKTKHFKLGVNGRQAGLVPSRFAGDYALGVKIDQMQA